MHHATPPRVGIVNYKNTLPLQYGLQQFANDGKIIITKDYPAALCYALQNNIIDIALLPVGFLPHLPYAKIITDVCIASENEVASVSLFSNVPIDEIKTVYLDYQSKSSIALVQILFKEYWQKEVELIQAPSNYIDLIAGNVAGVIIGDRAFEYGKNYKYNYDLANSWKLHTGLPFVFAVWVTTLQLDDVFIADFEQANKLGLNHIASIAKAANYKHYSLEKYYTENIKYITTLEMKKSIALFLETILKYNI